MEGSPVSREAGLFFVGHPALADALTIIRDRYVGMAFDCFEHRWITLVLDPEVTQLSARCAAILADLALDVALLLSRQFAIVLATLVFACLGILGEYLDIARHVFRTAEAWQVNCTEQDEYRTGFHDLAPSGHYWTNAARRDRFRCISGLHSWHQP
jgi:hypothetical protein